MHQFLVSAASFIVLVGVIVVVHEFGHFIVAKMCGVRVEAFSFGFGPRLFGFKYGETDYKISLLPLGGYVKMTGEASEQNLEVGSDKSAPAPEIDPASDPGSLLAHPRWQRMLIGAAGPIANFVLAIAVMLFYYAFINEIPTVTVKTPTVEWVTPDSAADVAGLKAGDEIVRFDTANQPEWEKVFERIKLNANQQIPVTVNRQGKTLQLSLHVPAAAKGEDYELSDAGILPQLAQGPIGVSSVQPGTPAEQAGLRSGDAISAVDGHTFHSVTTLIAYMQAGQGKPLLLTVLRNGQSMNIGATPAKLESGWKIGFIAALPPYKHDPLPLSAALNKSLVFNKNGSVLVGEVLQRLLSHRLAVSQLMGPVGIARAAGEATEMKGWMPKFQLASEISLQLGILNLLPFPILDGGMILLLLIESLMRHDISLTIKERIYQAAFVVLVAFFAFVLFNDVSKLGLFAHLKP
jgi:regulator of sigma E protease